MHKIRFSKYESLQNDFCIVDDRAREFRWTPKRVAAICHRRLGVGSDGLIVLEPALRGAFRFSLFNCDGSRAEWSGNGARCAAACITDKRHRHRFALDTPAGTISVQTKLQKTGQITVSYLRPSPIVGDKSEGDIAIKGAKGPFAVDAGNPHWIYLVKDFSLPWEEIGARCQVANPKTHGMNVEFVCVRDDGNIEIRVYERGVGPTPSSGSGALASVAVCLARGITGRRVKVISPGGDQLLEHFPDEESIRMTAAARLVCTGTWMSR